MSADADPVIFSLCLFEEIVAINTDNFSPDVDDVQRVNKLNKLVQAFWGHCKANTRCGLCINMHIFAGGGALKSIIGQFMLIYDTGLAEWLI